MTQPTVFISYSHEDEDWKDRLVTQLGVLRSQGLLDLWDDRRIGAGKDREQEIEKAMAAASVAILLVSADFLTSQFTLGKQVPRLLERRDKEGLCVFPVIIKPCAWQQVEWLARMQVRPKDGRPLSAGSEYQIDADLAAIATEVNNLLKTSDLKPISVRREQTTSVEKPPNSDVRQPFRTKTQPDDEATRSGSGLRRLKRPLRLLAWDLPVRVGSFVRVLGGAVDEITNWIIGIVILVAVILALLGILTQTQVLDLLRKALGR
jgi:hypothetical protein